MFPSNAPYHIKRKIIVKYLIKEVDDQIPRLAYKMATDFDGLLRFVLLQPARVSNLFINKHIESYGQRIFLETPISNRTSSHPGKRTSSPPSLEFHNRFAVASESGEDRWQHLQIQVPSLPHDLSRFS